METSPTLYELTNCKRKNSTLKSVFIHDSILEDCRIVDVEAYDQTGYNAINTTPKRFYDFVDYINRVILEHYEGIARGANLDIRVCIYGNYRHEYIITREGKTF